MTKVLTHEEIERYRGTFLDALLDSHEELRRMFNDQTKIALDATTKLESERQKAKDYAEAWVSSVNRRVSEKGAYRFVGDLGLGVVFKQWLNSGDDEDAKAACLTRAVRVLINDHINAFFRSYKPEVHCCPDCSCHPKTESACTCVEDYLKLVAGTFIIPSLVIPQSITCPEHGPKQ